jgi:hypothetical protein
MFENADLIHRYSRADAIRDGVLFDVSATAREAGIRFPVALTRAVWERCVFVPPGVLFQDEAGRLWEVCWRPPEGTLKVSVRQDLRQMGATGFKPAPKSLTAAHLPRMRFSVPRFIRPPSSIPCKKVALAPALPVPTGG